MLSGRDRQIALRGGATGFGIAYARPACRETPVDQNRCAMRFSDHGGETMASRFNATCVHCVGEEMRRTIPNLAASSFLTRPDRPIGQPNVPNGRRANRASCRLLAAALLLALASCKVGPDFAAPTAPLADRWLESGDASVHTDRQEYEQWWTVFNDATLNRLVDLAFRQNLTLMAAGTRVLEARATLGVAIGEFYPQTQLIGANVGYNQASQVDPTSNPQHELENYWRASLGTKIAWEVDLWGKFRRGVESADAAYLASIATYDDVLVTLLSDVATTYIGIRTLQQQIDIARENVVKQRKALQIATDRFHGGTATALDMYQAENVLAQTESMIPQLTAQLQQGEDALRVLLGMTPTSLDALLAGPQTIPVPPNEVAVGIPADLIRRRPDVRAVELNAAAQSAQIGLAKADLFPAFCAHGRVRNRCRNDRRQPSERGVQRTSHPVLIRPLVQLAHLQLRTDHQQRACAGRAFAGPVDPVPEHGAEGTTGGGERPERIPPGSPTGRLAAAKRRGGQQGPSRRTRPVSAGDKGLHHRADGGAEPLSGAEQPGHGLRQSLNQPRIDCTGHLAVDGRYERGAIS